MLRLPPPIVRRLVVAPLVLVLAALATVLSPVLLLVAAVLDQFLPGNWRTVRLLAVGVVYLFFQAMGILALLALWLGSGFGLGLSSPRFREVHYRFAHWWTGSLYSVVSRLLGIEIEIEDRLEPRTGPVLVFSRHAGPGDSILLAHMLMSGYRRRPRIVMKAELQWDPVIDVLGNRLPNAFIDPGARDGKRHIRSIAELAVGLGMQDALVLFPEGGNFSERRRRRAIASLQRKGYGDEAERAERMLHVIPPRPGGALAAISRAPRADVVFVAHTGLEDMASLRDLWRSVPLDRPLLGRYWRLHPDEVPRGHEEQVDWLFWWWAKIDEWIDDRRALRAAERAAVG